MLELVLSLDEGPLIGLVGAPSGQCLVSTAARIRLLACSASVVEVVKLWTVPEAISLPACLVAERTVAFVQQCTLVMFDVDAESTLTSSIACAKCPLRAKPLAIFPGVDNQVVLVYGDAVELFDCSSTAIVAHVPLQCARVLVSQSDASCFLAVDANSRVCVVRVTETNLSVSAPCTLNEPWGAEAVLFATTEQHVHVAAVTSHGASCATWKLARSDGSAAASGEPLANMKVLFAGMAGCVVGYTGGGELQVFDTAYQVALFTRACDPPRAVCCAVRGDCASLVVVTAEGAVEAWPVNVEPTPSLARALAHAWHADSVDVVARVGEDDWSTAKKAVDDWAIQVNACKTEKALLKLLARCASECPSLFVHRCALVLAAARGWMDAIKSIAESRCVPALVGLDALVSSLVAEGNADLASALLARAPQASAEQRLVLIRHALAVALDDGDAAALAFVDAALARASEAEAHACLSGLSALEAAGLMALQCVAASQAPTLEAQQSALHACGTVVDAQARALLNARSDAGALVAAALVRMVNDQADACRMALTLAPRISDALEAKKLRVAPADYCVEKFTL